MRWVLALGVVLMALAWAPLAVADNFSSTNYQVQTPTISSGGLATSTSFSLYGLLSPFVAGLSTSTTYGINPGFLAYPFVSTPVVSATAGDAQVALTWTSASGFLGYSVASYAVGSASVAGGPYTYSSVGNVLAHTASALTNGTTYYFVVLVLDGNGGTIATSSEVSAAPAAASSGGSGGGGGGGGGGSVLPNVLGSITVTVSGRAYPYSTVVLLKDAQTVLSTVAGGDAKFTMSLGNLGVGSYIFSLYGEDAKGIRSSLHTFPLSLTAGATTNVGGVFIAPTIDADKSEVRHGDNLVLFGASAPTSEVTIQVNSDTELFVKTKSDQDGAYLYTLDTEPLEMGSHSAKAKAVAASEISTFGAAVAFTVGTQSVAKTAAKKASKGDLSGDSKVNLVDFSVLVYWFKRPLSGTGLKADLNNDGKVDLVDFSILVYNWTG